MSIFIQVITYNECPTGGGFHELHKAEFLSSPQHALNTVQSIIDLNAKFCGDCIFKGADISCSTYDVAELIRDFYRGEDSIAVYISL